jgi:hypothetical protein
MDDSDSGNRGAKTVGMVMLYSDGAAIGLVGRASHLAAGLRRRD